MVSSALVFAVNNENPTAPVQPKVALLLMNNQSGKKVFPGSAVYRIMIYKSFYNFLKPLRFIKMVDGSKLTNTGWDEKKIDAITRNSQADLLIYGFYELGGQEKIPVIKMTVKLYQSSTRKVVYSKVYTSPTDRLIFDSIDLMMADTLKQIQKTSTINKIQEPGIAHPPEALKLSVLIFSNFSIGSCQYNLLVNDQWMDLITGDDYHLQLSVLPAENYNIVLKKNDDNRTVLNTNIVFGPAETNVLRYEARGTFVLSALDGKEQWKSYKCFLNGLEVREDQVFSNTNAGYPYHLSVLDNRTNRIYETNCYLDDSGFLKYNPAIKWTGGLHIKLYKTEETYAGAGLDGFINRYLWLGGGLGFWTAYDPFSAKSILFLYPYLEAGYYFWGDQSYPLRAGAGLIGEMYFCLPQKPDVSSPVMNNAFYGIGAFVVGEYLIFFIRPAVYYDLTRIRTQIAVGVKF